MPDAHPPSPRPIDADDPRISEWIDGRLSAAEAAEIDRAVQASPELVALVEELKTIRGAMRGGVASDPSAGFGDRVMAAVAASQNNDPDFGPAPGMRPSVKTSGRQLPWLALAGALAAGLLVAIVVNRPEENGRDVALAPPAEPLGRLGGDRDQRRESDQLDRVVEETAPTKQEPTSRARALGQAAPAESASSAETLKRGAAAKEGESMGLAADTPAHDDGDLNTSLAKGSNRFRPDATDDKAFGGGSPAPQAASGPADTGLRAPATPAPPAAALPRAALADASEAKDKPIDKAAESLDEVTSRQAGRRAPTVLAGVLVIAVGSPSERRALDQLVASSGLEARPEGDHLELAGTPAAIKDFLGELERVGLVSGVTSPRAKKADGQVAARQDDREQARLVLRIVERTKQPRTENAAEDKEAP